MLLRSCSLAWLASLCLSALLCTSASAVGSDLRIPQRRPDEYDPYLVPRDTHSHSHSHAEPLLVLNETEILQGHAPDPLSYWAHDFGVAHEQAKTWRGLMGVHVIGMGLAFFVLLPVGIALRSVNHRWHGASVVAFNIVAFTSSAAGTLYKKLTGDLYEGSAHGRGGFVVLTLVAILAICDTLALLRRAASFVKGSDRTNIRRFWSIVILNQQDPTVAEYSTLVHEEPGELEYVEAKLAPRDEDVPAQVRRARFVGTIDTSQPASPWSNHEDWPQSAASNRTFVNHGHRHSINSDDTLHTPTSYLPVRDDYYDSQDSLPNRPWFSRIGHALFTAAERAIILLAFVQLLSGVTVYTGMCRENYLNGCMAHLIKGGIFWCYGLLSFSRYLGTWADFGWAWNRLPARRAKNIPSAEAIECFVIFFYGVTNTWMERFGAAPGSPFTTKQIQHISIAVMFWFAGLLGLALESKAFRRWLSSPAQSLVNVEEPISQPPSYTGSFNPFPALVIGVTGVAMSAHHQTYLFQVQIHALWGFFLAGFALLRCLTYVFLWLRPPHSVLPSRPPTEALSSFFLASGGLVFILSTEQITFAAMRRGFDDVMFIFNFAVAVTCLAFCWLLGVTAFKGWITSRSRASRPTFVT